MLLSYKLAAAFSDKAEAALRRIQRLIAECIIDSKLVAKLILKFLPIEGPYSLSMDRTNWKYSDTNINIFTLGVIYDGMTFPVLFKMMNMRSYSNTAERIEIVDRFISIAEDQHPSPDGRQGVCRKRLARLSLHPTDPLPHQDTGQLQGHQARKGVPGFVADGDTDDDLLVGISKDVTPVNSFVQKNTIKHILATIKEILKEIQYSSLPFDGEEREQNHHLHADSAFTIYKNCAFRNNFPIFVHVRGILFCDINILEINKVTKSFSGFPLAFFC